MTCELKGEGLNFTYPNETRPDVKDVSLTLKSGRVYGVFGQNASGKTTLARLLVGTRTAQTGSVHLTIEGEGEGEGGAEGRDVRGAQSGRGFGLISRMLLYTAALAAIGVIVASAVCGARKLPPQLRALHPLHATCRRALGNPSGGDAASAALLAASVAVAVLIPLLALLLRGEASDDGKSPADADCNDTKDVVHIHSEDDPGNGLARANPLLTIKECISAHMKGESEDAKRIAAVSLLRVSGFQMFNEKGDKVGSPESYYDGGIKVANLSGGQKHRVYTLRMLAINARVLLLDEVLGGLDADGRARMLYILRTLCAGAPLPPSFKWVKPGTPAPAILCATTDLQELGAMTAPLPLPPSSGEGGTKGKKALTAQIAYMHEGAFVEVGDAADVLYSPQHAQCRGYVGAFRTMMRNPAERFGLQYLAAIDALKKD